MSEEKQPTVEELKQTISNLEGMNKQLHLLVQDKERKMNNLQHDYDNLQDHIVRVNQTVGPYPDDVAVTLTLSPAYFFTLDSSKRELYWSYVMKKLAYDLFIGLKPK